ncbi:GLPGLI family protein [Chryseobacterium balustinum]|uniref:GLPGLI family protein n=1 Tax=Chryseobacterium balustinum TaxID=246 RepID=A0AAX2IP77_9FLAO|nr:GLPGLI family protein [Chryseobacterium balustinum]AZB29120.1 GLPGLI family protein [Chryseobacterium balustinum]SKC07812.1 GLPGLI family protein [Chryseobacterium balustinum]SQA91622.1 GLPGLI family protein [Chryseobacterium balustinum]
MKTKLSILLLLITGFCFAQSNQFIYEYTFKMDSLNRDKSDTENMILQTSPKGSKFYSQVRAVFDSTTAATVASAVMSGKDHFDFTHLKRGKVGFEVHKTYPDYKTTLKKSIGSTGLLITTDQKIIWKITNEKDKVLGYDVQKATADWRGRKWIVWFAPEIPLQDGPHIFSGLPGLIVKIEDTKGDHSFKLIATKKVNAVQKENESTVIFKPKDIPINEEKFRKLWKEYKEDPVKDLRQMHGSSSGAAIISMSLNGETITPEEILRKSEISYKEQIKKVNNFLELDLYR